MQQASASSVSKSEQSEREALRNEPDYLNSQEVIVKENYELLDRYCSTSFDQTKFSHQQHLDTNENTQETTEEHEKKPENPIK